MGAGQKLFILRGLSVAIIIGLTSLSHADQYFQNLRIDKRVPEKCQATDINQFSGYKQIQKVIFGIKGYKAYGFTDEYPINREQATLLWTAFKGGKENRYVVDRLLAHPESREAYQAILANYQEMGFDFHSEGEVLELLAILEMYKRLPNNKYYVTGGVSYHARQSTQTIGELDILVADRDTCQIVIVGEAKLGYKQLGHAREQLTRLYQFLNATFSQAANQRVKAAQDILTLN